MAQQLLEQKSQSASLARPRPRLHPALQGGTPRLASDLPVTLAAAANLKIC